MDGYEEPVFHRGEVCGHVRRYSDRLMELLLCGHRPEKYRNRTDQDVTGTATLVIDTGIDRSNGPDVVPPHLDPPAP